MSVVVGKHSKKDPQISDNMRSRCVFSPRTLLIVAILESSLPVGRMLFSARITKQLAGVILMAGIYALAQRPKTAMPQATQPKFKAIWEPANVTDDVELRAVYFTSPEEGWVTGGRTEVAGGVIYHTKDAGATWEDKWGHGDRNKASAR